VRGLLPRRKLLGPRAVKITQLGPDDPQSLAFRVYDAAVALTPEQEWSIVACGLIAHADGELSAGECDPVLAAIDERLAPEERTKWTAILTDRDALEQHLVNLPPPLPLFYEEMLERAWSIALADGAGSEAEREVFDLIADTLGCDSEEVARWREQWDQRAATVAGEKACFAALLIHADGVIDPDEATAFRNLVQRLPVDASRRAEFEALLVTPPKLDDVKTRLAGLPRERRLEVLRSIAPLIFTSSQAEVGAQMFRELARGAAAPADVVEQLLTPPT